MNKNIKENEGGEKRAIPQDIYRVGGRSNESEAKRVGRIAVSATNMHMRRGSESRPTR